MRVKDNMCSWGPRWLSVGTVLTVLCQFPSVGAADVLWSWSFSTESGTFVTSGTFAETAGAAEFTFKSFSVSASQVAGNVGASYNEGSQPIQTMSWDGSQPTQFTRAGGMYTNGSNFYRDDDLYFYGLFAALGAGPPIGTLLDSNEDTVTEGSLTIVPLGALLPCVGDCDDNRQVTVDEILTMVNIALGNAEISKCDTGDANNDGQITVDEILTAVSNALNGCGGGSQAELACIYSGGAVSTGTCCLAVDDFPQTCATGACSCGPG